MAADSNTISRTHKHVNLSGIKGFLGQFDQKQTCLLVKTVAGDLNRHQRDLENASIWLNVPVLGEVCRSIQTTSGSFQLDFLASEAVKIEEMLGTGALDHALLSNFRNYLVAVNTALKKLEMKICQSVGENGMEVTR